MQLYFEGMRGTTRWSIPLVFMLLIPASLLAFILLSFNFLGDALRDQFDARSEP